MKEEPMRLLSTSRSWLASVFASLIALLMMQTAFALPQAGSVIRNQATVTYTDASGETRSVTSNLVETLVDQVAAVDLAGAQTKPIAIGGTVYFPHTATNTGNGPDPCDLTDGVNGFQGSIDYLVTGNVVTAVITSALQFQILKMKLRHE